MSFSKHCVVLWILANMIKLKATLHGKVVSFCYPIHLLLLIVHHLLNFLNVDFLLHCFLGLERFMLSLLLYFMRNVLTCLSLMQVNSFFLSQTQNQDVSKLHRSIYIDYNLGGSQDRRHNFAIIRQKHWIGDSCNCFDVSL